MSCTDDQVALYVSGKKFVNWGNAELTLVGDGPIPLPYIDAEGKYFGPMLD